MDILTISASTISSGLRPLESVLFLLGITLILSIRQRINSKHLRWGIPLAFAILFYGLYLLAQNSPDIGRWLYRLESPSIPPILLLVIPAVFLPRNRGYRLFLALPALFLCGLVAQIAVRLNNLPADAAFAGFPASPGMLALGVVSGLVLVQPFLCLIAFRRIVRITVFVVLMFGGFLFRQNAADYKAMLERRAVARRDIVSFAETTPVLRDSERLTYLPAAPCRFSADGGYVQGCSMELLQRLLQLDFRKVAAGSVEETSLLSLALGALASLFALLFIGARFWCGWACPLAIAGDAFDRLRVLLHIPHLQTPARLKRAVTDAGFSLGSFGLLLSATIPRLDAEGRFLGCKIPLYPFCKFCPGQQVCPVASSGPGAYPPLPGREWLGGFFLIAAVTLGLFFVIAFASMRRLFCHFCPMGMIGGMFNRGGLVTLRKTPVRCNGCGICREVCPMDIPEVATEQIHTNVTTSDCIFCLECLAKCPQKDCLHFDFAGRTLVSSDWPKPATKHPRRPTP